MDFRKFSSLENTYREKHINQILEEVPSDTRWAVTEKLHGCNFSFWSDGETVRYAKRSGFIGEGESFYNFRGMKDFEKISEAVRDEAREFGARIALFGELFGPGVQSGVNYGDEKRFAAFDLAVDGAPVNYWWLAKILDRLGIERPHCFADNVSFKEALEFSEEFPTFSGPRVADNLAEGIVIAPVVPRYLTSGSRVYLKKKHPRFAEKVKGPKKEKVEVNLAEAHSRILETLQTYVTPERFDSVLSKEGEFNQRLIGKYIGLMMQDVIGDYEADGFGNPKRDAEDAWKQIQSEVVADIRKLILSRI